MVRWKAVRGAGLFFCGAALLIGLLLIGLFRVDFVIGAPVAVVIAGCIVATLTFLQWWLNKRGKTIIRAERNPELGLINVFSDSWCSFQHGSHRGHHFTIQGSGRRSGPTAGQLSQWREFNLDFERRINEAISSLQALPQAPRDSMSVDNFLLNHVSLGWPRNELGMLFLYSTGEGRIPFVGSVRFGGNSIASARWLRSEK